MRPSSMELNRTCCWALASTVVCCWRRWEASRSERAWRCCCWKRPRHQKWMVPRAAKVTMNRKNHTGMIQPKFGAEDKDSAGGLFHEAVADAADGIKVFGRGTNFFTEAAHVGIHRAGINEGIVLPDIAE